MDWLRRYLEESGQSLLEGGQHIVRALGDVTPFNAQMAGELAPPNAEMKGLAKGLLDAPMAVGAPLRVPQRATPGPAMSTPKGWDKVETSMAEPPLQMPSHSSASQHRDVLGDKAPDIREVSGWPFGPHPQRRSVDEIEWEAAMDRPITAGKPTSARREGDPDYGLTMLEMQKLANRFGFTWDKNLGPNDPLGSFSPQRGAGHLPTPWEDKTGAISLRPEYKDNVQRTLVSAHELSHGIDWKSVPGAGYSSTHKMTGRGKPGEVNTPDWRVGHEDRPNWEAELREITDAGSLARMGASGSPKRRGQAVLSAAGADVDGTLMNYEGELYRGVLGEPTKEVYADALALYLTDPRFMKEYFPNAAQFFRENVNRSEVGKWLQLNAGPALLAGTGAAAGLLAPDEAFADDQLQDETLREVME